MTRCATNTTNDKGKRKYETTNSDNDGGGSVYCSSQRAGIVKERR